MADSFNHFPVITKAIHKALSQTVRKAALDIQAQAIIRAPVDTGFLRASIYTVTDKSSSYGKGRTGGKTGGKKNVYKALTQELLPEVDPPGDDLTAYVAVGASYGFYVEMGTHTMSAQPYFYPAVEAVKPGFEAALSKIEDKIKEQVH